MLKYTFYGDLLGIGNTYKLGEHIAYNELEKFYNTSFKYLENLRIEDSSCDVEMFSDSIFIIGNDAISALRYLNKLFSVLLSDNLLLRGAMVSGRLNYEPNITDKTFKNRLPSSNTLARATGLEKSYKGSRLIIESSLAIKMFEDIPAWLTHIGYYKNKSEEVDDEDILRKICPAPDNTAYELLYYWTPDTKFSDYKEIIKQLTHLMRMQSEDLKIQYSETINLIKRSEERHRISTN